MVMGQKRHKYYSAIETWGPTLSVPGVTFVNLQYGDVAAELELARGYLGDVLRTLGLARQFQVGEHSLDQRPSLLVVEATSTALQARSAKTRGPWWRAVWLQPAPIIIPGIGQAVCLPARHSPTGTR
jgi:hypothetical protein